MGKPIHARRERVMIQAIDVSGAAAPVKQRSRFRQFSVRSLLVLTTICCAILAGIACPPLFVIGAVLALLALSIFCVIAMIYGRGWIRPFSILCGVSLFCFFITSLNMRIHGPGEASLFFLIQLAGSMFVGLCGATAHGFLKKRSGIVPIPNIPFVRSWLHNPE